MFHKNFFQDSGDLDYEENPWFKKKEGVLLSKHDTKYIRDKQCYVSVCIYWSIVEVHFAELFFIWGNGIGDQSSKPGRDSLYFTLH